MFTAKNATNRIENEKRSPIIWSVQQLPGTYWKSIVGQKAGHVDHIPW
mgnify:CR=1 FL=1